MPHLLSLQFRGFTVAFLTLAALTAAAKPDTAATAGTLRVECANNICSAIVHDKRTSIAPCANSVILLAWRQSGGATLIQCETDDADMDKPSFAFNRDLPSGPAFSLTGMRFFDSSYLDELASSGVPDKFAPHALCQPPRPAHVATGELLIGEKVPFDDDKNPYCYRLLRIATTSTGVAIHADDKKSPKPQTAHAEWDALAAKMTALIRASGGATAAAAAPVPTSAGIAHVIAARAPLRDSADAGATAHGYLVRGDEVTLLDRSKLADGWLKVRYVDKSGKAIDRWVHADDLDATATAATTH